MGVAPRRIVLPSLLVFSAAVFAIGAGASAAHAQRPRATAVKGARPEPSARFDLYISEEARARGVRVEKIHAGDPTFEVTGVDNVGGMLDMVLRARGHVMHPVRGGGKPLRTARQRLGKGTHTLLYFHPVDASEPAEYHTIDGKPAALRQVVLIVK